jgi:hypothetical protein
MRTRNDPENAATRRLVPLRTRMWRGLLWGWSVAAIFIVLATVIGALVPREERWLAALIIVTYWIVSSIAGVVLGMLAPYLAGGVRKVLMGFLLATIMFSGAAVVVKSGRPMPEDVLLVLVISAVWGPLFGVLYPLVSRFSPELKGWPLSDYWP